MKVDIQQKYKLILKKGVCSKNTLHTLILFSQKCMWSSDTINKVIEKIFHTKVSELRKPEITTTKIIK